MDKRSFEKINYLIRPSKQIERKLFIESLHNLGKTGYNVSDYTYLGFGSIFFADFILFHKYLYIDKMICVESANIEKRMKFNKPFDFIELRMKPVSDVIPSLSDRKKYLVWLDYDCTLNTDILDDIDGFICFLPTESILIVTVEAEPILKDDYEFVNLSSKEKGLRLEEYYRKEFDNHLPGNFSIKDFSRSALPNLLWKIITSQIRTSLIYRLDIDFYQLYNFKYADGAQMLTIGGIIEEKSKKSKIEKSDAYDLHYITMAQNPLKISVPPLTIREKHWVDQRIKKGLNLDRVKFEIDEDLLKNYISFYKHYPQYYEAVL